MSINLYAAQPQLNWHANMAFDSAGYWPGVGLSATGNIGRYFALGGVVNTFFNYSSKTANGTVVDTRQVFIDVDILIKPQIPISVKTGELIVYLAIYGGVTPLIETTRNYFNSQTSTYWGWNVAVTPGVQYHFNNGLGLFTELGFVDRDWWTGQNRVMGVFNLGMSYAF